jgi:hypothetical protein
MKTMKGMKNMKKNLVLFFMSFILVMSFMSCFGSLDSEPGSLKQT